MRRTLFVAAAALVVFATDVAAAELNVSKVFNTSEQASMGIDEYTDVWLPIHSDLVATAVFDDSNRYQGTDVVITRWAYSYNGPRSGYSHFYRTMTCRIHDRVLRVSHGSAELVATTLDPASPDCSTYGYRLDCDPEWNCDYNENYGFPGPRLVQGSWGQPVSSISATSTLQSTANTMRELRRINQVCKTFEGRGMPGFFSIGSLLWYTTGSVVQTQCQATQQLTDPWQ